MRCRVNLFAGLFCWCFLDIDHLCVKVQITKIFLEFVYISPRKKERKKEKPVQKREARSKPGFET